MILGAALKRAFVNGSELSAVTIRAVLLADISADLFQLSYGSVSTDSGVALPHRIAGASTKQFRLSGRCHHKVRADRQRRIDHRPDNEADQGQSREQTPLIH